MRNLEILTLIQEVTYDELNESDRKLVDKARHATLNAYSPYSHFSVGAAILLGDGTVVEGSNQENIAYPSGLCAERTAAFYAHSKYPSQPFVKIAVAARDTSGNEVKTPIAPCGACRQVLLEYEKLSQRDVEVLLCSAGAIYRIPSVRSLLPITFTEFS